MMTSDGNVGDNVLDFKLVDVPELGYFTTDKPFPRGELLIKTKTMIAGYYKHQDVSTKPSKIPKNTCLLEHLATQHCPDFSYDCLT